MLIARAPSSRAGRNSVPSPRNIEIAPTISAPAMATVIQRPLMASRKAGMCSV